MKKGNGFTLCELLCTLTIISVLTTLGIPSFTDLVENTKSQDLYNQLFTLIQYTRSKAAFLNEDVILCPTTDENTCINDWQRPVMIFVDKNRNRRRDNSEDIDRISQLHTTNSTLTLTWRASGTSRYLRFISNGSTASQNGSFRICPQSGRLEHTKKIIVYMSGRARSALKSEITAKDCN
jgi:type IV fimbrial biogenesis protein FimT